MPPTTTPTAPAPLVERLADAMPQSTAAARAVQALPTVTVTAADPTVDRLVHDAAAGMLRGAPVDPELGARAVAARQAEVRQLAHRETVNRVRALLLAEERDARIAEADAGLTAVRAELADIVQVGGPLLRGPLAGVDTAAAAIGADVVDEWRTVQALVQRYTDARAAQRAIMLDALLPGDVVPAGSTYRMAGRDARAGKNLGDQIALYAWVRRTDGGPITRPPVDRDTGARIRPSWSTGLPEVDLWFALDPPTVPWILGDVEPWVPSLDDFRAAVDVGTL